MVEKEVKNKAEKIKFTKKLPSHYYPNWFALSVTSQNDLLLSVLLYQPTFPLS